MLQRALASDRVPHGYLFAGPPGVGKEMMAVRLAGLLLCPHVRPVEPPNGAGAAAGIGWRDACWQCRPCELIAAGTHPDLHVISRQLHQHHPDPQVRQRRGLELSVEVIRHFLIAPAYVRPAVGAAKVFIVQEADRMSHAAQNALLKTLEEPPPRTTLILICPRPEQLLPTTRSRCALVGFRLLPDEFVLARLAEAGLAEGEGRFWAAFTGGSLGRALALGRQGMYAVKRDLVERLAALGAAGDADLGSHLAKTTDKLADRAVAAAKEADGASLSKNLAARQAVAAMLELIASAYRDALTIRTGADLAIVHADQARGVQTLARRFEPTDLAEILEQLAEYERLLWRNVNPKIVWDNVVITCATAAPLRL